MNYTIEKIRSDIKHIIDKHELFIKALRKKEDKNDFDYFCLKSAENANNDLSEFLETDENYIKDNYLSMVKKYG